MHPHLRVHVLVVDIICQMETCNEEIGNRKWVYRK